MSFRLCPILVAPGLPALPRKWYVLSLETSKRWLNHCHLAQRRSTLACSRKNSGSLAAVPMLDIEPPKLTCAAPCGLLSIRRNRSYWLPGLPSASVAGSSSTGKPSMLFRAASVRVLNLGGRTIPGTPSVAQNCSGLPALKRTAPVTPSATPMSSRLKSFGAG